MSTKQNEIEQALIDLFTQRRSGHLLPYAYLDNGSEFYNRFIMGNNFYYPNNAERELFSSDEETYFIGGQKLRKTKEVIIIGPGPVSSVSAKELRLIQEMPNVRKIHLVDISMEFNTAATLLLKHKLKNTSLEITTHTHDYRTISTIGNLDQNTTLMCTGSFIGNIENAAKECFAEEELRDVLATFKNLCGHAGNILIGYDSTCAGLKLDRAYNHPLLKDFFINMMKNCFKKSNNIAGINPDEIEDIFEYTPQWHRNARHYAFNLEANQSFELRYKENTIIPINQGAVFTIGSSIKPSTSIITEIASKIGMEHEISLTSNGGTTIQLLSITPT